MSLKRVSSLLLMAALLLPIVAMAQKGESELNPAPPSGISTDDIIQRFAAKEAEFKREWGKYTYRQDVKVQTLEGNSPDGEYHQVSDMVFNDQGKRIERVVFAPQSSLRRISMTQEDFDDIQNRFPFALTTQDLPDYRITYAGQQKEDELDTYVFDVAPREIVKGRRYFQGRIWVDKQDFQIVKSKGRVVPDVRGKKGSGENLFPEYETYYEEIDGKYWFPTYTRADDMLHFSTGDVHIRIVERYSNYRRFGSDVKITYEGQDISKGDEKKPK